MGFISAVFIEILSTVSVAACKAQIQLQLQVAADW